MKHRNEDGVFVEYQLALVLTTIPENCSNMELLSKSEYVRNSPASGAWLVFGVGDTVVCGYVIPEIATGRKTADRGIERWFVNCQIDLLIWNDVYN
jgi:hypothetical protein